MAEASTALQQLARLAAKGLPRQGEAGALTEQIEQAMEEIFRERYRRDTHWLKRVRYMEGDSNVPFAGFVHPESPSSGQYGGMSLIWFPVRGDENESGASLITFVCGTRGLAPDEHILGRPGHARNLEALKRYLAEQVGVRMWCKHDPANLSQTVPEVVRRSYPRFKDVFGRYGEYLYAMAELPPDESAAVAVFSAFLDLYAWERGWTPLSSAQGEIQRLQNALRSKIFPSVNRKDVVDLLFERRFVILQGPPGTGKSRMADEILRQDFRGNGMSVQFHPAVTYETFISGIAPQVGSGNLTFAVRSGTLVDAIQQAGREPYLLHIDEINRADLGSILGEAIYLLEAREISQGQARQVRLPQPLSDGRQEISIPPNLYILGTMNSADRSIAILDLAVRRRFAFVDIWPNLEVIEDQGLELGTTAFAYLIDLFRQYANEESLCLLPGHAYFLADSEAELRNRLQFELLPLLRDYIRDGRVGQFESELRAYIGWLEGELALNA
jgi:5-methylcytosine-specific restriction protein B